MNIKRSLSIIVGQTFLSNLFRVLDHDLNLKVRFDGLLTKTIEVLSCQRMNRWHALHV